MPQPGGSGWPETSDQGHHRGKLLGSSDSKSFNLYATPAFAYPITSHSVYSSFYHITAETVKAAGVSVHPRGFSFQRSKKERIMRHNDLVSHIWARKPPIQTPAHCSPWHNRTPNLSHLIPHKCYTELFRQRSKISRIYHREGDFEICSSSLKPVT